MFKRFNPNYMAVLFLVDAMVIQVALMIAIALRYSLELEQLLPNSTPHVIGPGLHLTVMALSVSCFLLNSVYTARKVVLWFDEMQRVLLASIMTCLSVTGMLYLTG